MKLVSDRLYLRDIRQSDLDAVHEYAGSFEVVRHQEWGPNTVEQTEEFIAGCLEAGAMPDSRTLNLGVALDNDKLIGSYRATLSEDGADAEIGRLGVRAAATFTIILSSHWEDGSWRFLQSRFPRPEKDNSADWPR